ncbi:LysR substrate-binding domain-containing protein [Thioclava sp. GXIMD2076]|uniref:LysR substrate-binding domain-containing protein n=1 Tax=unclassified Thioclava TaxID=2621713 RepID=UPI0030CE1988
MSRLPPLRLLTTFEAIARHGSMHLAAARLNVTQPAISQSLKALEDHVGAQLLDRSTRPARLTEAGEILARAVREGLGRISVAVEDIRDMAGLGGQQVTVSCTIGMATYWLMPRLPDFYAKHPEITVNVQAPASDLPHLAPGIDIAIRYGTGNWHEGRTFKLFEERIFPVAAPALLERLQREGIGLEAAPLIHVRSPRNQHWAGWEEYFLARGIIRERLTGQTFTNYVQAAQAVLDGRGVMLGWRSIAAGAVREKTLCPWPDGELDLGTSYFVTTTQPVSQSTNEFTAWLSENAKKP